jgi:hypothetical protein
MWLMFEGSHWGVIYWEPPPGWDLWDIIHIWRRGDVRIITGLF